MELGDIGEVLNEYFASVFTVGKDDVGIETRERHCDSLQLVNIEREEF